MAFQFNWSPLIADTSRAREMLTTALNKSPKPPIIVDDIIVTELNLGSTPPELEILEIGDLAEDRFRGIFKMSYSGDAFLTLKTRVQANPLNTYLFDKPSFASPQPLAASSSLTIPLQITLSDIVLSGFVILVFSRQKGITLVFRNDPLESLKVSSTFDSIPFVREYLQKEIEAQLRVLFMEDLPAIIHRLSLRLWVEEHSSRDEVNSNNLNTSYSDKVHHTESSPPQRPYDRPLDTSDFQTFSFDALSESQSTFSQKNLLRLAALDDSHRTLSLFTPPIRDVVFRAWAGAAERGGSPIDATGTSNSGLNLSSLSRAHFSNPSLSSMAQSYDAASTISSLGVASTIRPSLTSTSSLPIGVGRPRTRKRKKRVVNLRKPKEIDADGEELESAQGSKGSRPSTPASSMEQSSSYFSGSNEREGEITTPPQSPEQRLRMTALGADTDRTVRGFNRGTDTGIVGINDAPLMSPQPRQVQHPSSATKSHQALLEKVLDGSEDRPTPRNRNVQTSSSSPSYGRAQNDESGNARNPVPTQYPSEKMGVHPYPLGTVSNQPPSQPSISPTTSTPYTGSILEQAWIMKMANEVAEKVRREREREHAAANNPATSRQSGKARISDEDTFWSSGGRSTQGAEEPPPPAYAA